MKLSDIKGDKVLDVIADIIVPIANIASDEKASEIFSRKPLPQGVTAKEFLVERVKGSIPTLIKNHKDDLITILSAIGDATKEEYSANLTLASILRDFTELLTDEEFLALFG